MSKKTIIIIAIILVLACAGGVSGYFVYQKSQQTDSSTESTSTSNDDDSTVSKIEAQMQEEAQTKVDDAVSSLKSSGFTVEESEDDSDDAFADYQVPNPLAETQLNVDGTSVKIYAVDTEKIATRIAERAEGNSSTTFATNTLVVVVYSTDSTVVSSIQTALQ